MRNPFDKPFKTMIMGYFLPLLGAAIVAFIPEYDHLFAMWIIAVFVILLLLPIIFVIRFPDNKEKAYRLTLMYQLYAFTFYFTFPLLKVLRGDVVYQLLLVGLFIAIFFLARFDQRTEVPLSTRIIIKIQNGFPMCTMELEFCLSFLVLEETISIQKHFLLYLAIAS